jgi:hypothetical protein
MFLINDNDGVLGGPIRAVFRVYFLISFLLLGLVGSQVVKCVNKVRLLRGQSLTMVQMTGWFRSTDIAKCLIKMRRLPGGPLPGSFMVVAGNPDWPEIISRLRPGTTFYRHPCCGLPRILRAFETSQGFHQLLFRPCCIHDYRG